MVHGELCPSGSARPLRLGKVVAAAGEGRVASASREDYAAGAVAVLLREGHEGKVYECSGDYAWNYDELAGAIADISGKPVVYEPVDGATMMGILKVAGMDENTAGFIAALDENTAAGLLFYMHGRTLNSLFRRPTTSSERDCARP